jgi:hypothetical protein
VAAASAAITHEMPGHSQQYKECAQVRQFAVCLLCHQGSCAAGLFSASYLLLSRQLGCPIEQLGGLRPRAPSQLSSRCVDTCTSCSTYHIEGKALLMDSAA